MGGAPVALLAELVRFAEGLRALGIDCDDDVLVEIAGDLHALVARHAVEALRGRAA